MPEYDNTRIIETLETGSVDTDQATVGGDRVERVGPQRVARAGLREGLVGHWPLTDLSTGLEDTVNGNDISTTGSPTVESDGGAFGAAVRFGSGDYGEIAHSGELSVESGAFTISAYIRSPADSQATLIVQKRAATNGDTQTSYTTAIGGSSNGGPGGPWSGVVNGVMGGYGDGSSVISATSDVAAGTGPLYHVAMTYDPADNRVTVYYNGYTWATDDLASAPAQNDDEVRIGAKLDGSGGIDFDSDLIISDLRIYDRKLPYGEIQTLSRLPYPDSRTFRVKRETELFSGTLAGPVYRYDDSKSDPHRLLIKDRSQTGDPVDLYTASGDPFDASNWSVASSDVISGYADATATEPSDYVYDGSTFWVYMQDGSDDSVQVFSGSDWTGTNLTHDSQISIDNDEDVGSFRDDGGTVYLYAEGDEGEIGVGSNYLTLWTASSPNGSFTERRNVLDLSNTPWHTGDPDIEEIDGTYWMFTDNTESHASYGTTLLRSTDLFNWEVVTEDVKVGRGGDLEVAEYGDGLIGFTELDGPDEVGVGIWSVNGPQ
jgi:hypothetical protein